MAEGSLYDIEVQDIQGTTQSLGAYRGQVLLIVNTASKCGFTSQYEGLQSLYRDLKERGFTVLGFPCNQFLNQDPADNDSISQFCSLNYGVEFPMFAKLQVNGPQTHPLYRFLKSQARGLLGSEKIKWNFTKFLVNREGEVVERYGPSTRPEAIRRDVESLL